MAKKARAKRTPAVMLWAMIDAERRTQKLSYRALSKLCGCSDNTVCLDANCPERIPQSRLWLYFTALGIDITSVIVPVAEAFIGKFTKEESA